MAQENKTKIGSSDTFIEIEDGSMKFTVSGIELLTFCQDPTTSNVVTEFASKAYVDSRTITDLAPQTADYNCRGYKITGSGTPTDDYDLTTKVWVLSKISTTQEVRAPNTATSFIKAHDDRIQNGNTPFNMGYQKITNILNGTAGSNEASTVKYVDDQINSFIAQSGGSRIVDSVNSNSKLTALPSSLLCGSTPLHMNGQSITNIQQPTDQSPDHDAATVGYVKSKLQDTQRIINPDYTDSSITAEQHRVVATIQLDMDGNQIKEVAKPTANRDVVTKEYLIDDYNPNKIVSTIGSQTFTINSTKLLTSVPLDMNGKALNTVALPATREDGLPRKYIDKYIHNASNDGNHTNPSIYNALNVVGTADNNVVIVQNESSSHLSAVSLQKDISLMGSHDTTSYAYIDIDVTANRFYYDLQGQLNVVSDQRYKTSIRDKQADSNEKYSDLLNTVKLYSFARNKGQQNINNEDVKKKVYATAMDIEYGVMAQEIINSGFENCINVYDKTNKVHKKLYDPFLSDDIKSNITKATGSQFDQQLYEQVFNNRFINKDQVDNKPDQYQYQLNQNQFMFTMFGAMIKMNQEIKDLKQQIGNL